ncbi:hypothetical protein [Aliiroseovarius sp. PrR006]|uniref:hypothetical protein n=1 Tax=Aliiroseovarius sp. PrR006 TaxID=2706883 RepID=UPI0013D061E6|nr:hypothetical protein [Aliiroseovarius sp. PrR006]NDW54301.1 hypothetical protein [Aliiroseovarius sp. PrR006]
MIGELRQVPGPLGPLALVGAPPSGPLGSLDALAGVGGDTGLTEDEEEAGLDEEDALEDDARA